MTRLSGSDAHLSTSPSRSTRAPAADDVGRSRSKACTDLFRRRGNDIVEALIDGISVAQDNVDMGALVGRERGGKARLALQAGMLDEAENPGIVDLRVIFLFERAARAARRRR